MESNLTRLNYYVSELRHNKGNTLKCDELFRQAKTELKDANEINYLTDVYAVCRNNGQDVLDAYSNENNLISKYGIVKQESRSSQEYYGRVNGHEFYWKRAKDGLGGWTSALSIDERDVDCHSSTNGHKYLTERDGMTLPALIKILETDDFSGIVFEDESYELDDYEESLVEAVSEDEKDALRKALTSRTMSEVANGWATIKKLEIVMQEVIESMYPGKSWWQVTNCNIFWSLLGNEGNARQTIDEIIDGMKVGAEDAQLDDYNEDFNSSTQMTDAQRLALQELEYCLEYGEISQEEHDMGLNIQWDINSEDVVLFIAGMDTLGVSLSDIEHVEYGDCDESEFDGCYSVTMSNGSVKKYGWHDMDMTGALTAIEDSSSLSEDIDGWEKRFDWANKYYKDSMIISGVRGYPDCSKISHWHLESTRPEKHFGNFSSLEAAKAAGDKEIDRKNKSNRSKEPQFGVHQFSTNSIIFRGTDRECGKFIDDHEELWDDAEVYMIMPDDPHYRNLDEDYARVSAKDFVKHPMNHNVTGELKFKVPKDVKVYVHRGPGKQKEFYVVIGDKYVDHSFNSIETVKKYLVKQKLLKESVSNTKFLPGDFVYVNVCNRHGRVSKMISDDVVEVELDDGVNPVRLDRFYTNEIELL